MGIEPWLANGWQVFQDVSLQSVLLAASLGAFLWLFRIRHPALQHRAWLGLTVGMLIWPLVALWVPTLEIPWYSVPEAEVPGTTRITVVSVLPTTSPAPSSEEVGTLSFSARSEVPGTGSEVPGTFPWQMGLAWLYGLGVAVMLARLLLGWKAVKTLRRHSTPMGDTKLHAVVTDILGPRAALTELRLASSLDVPACFGWRRPVIFLPTAFSAWDAQKQEAVLAHECHHIRRADSLSQTLALINRSLYWFHPLAWWLPKQLSQLAERACDAGAVGHGVRPQLYARYLLEVAAMVTPSGRPSLAQSMAAHHDLEGRVRAILDRRTVGGSRAPRWAPAWTVVLCLVVVGVAASDVVPKEDLSGSAHGAPMATEFARATPVLSPAFDGTPAEVAAFAHPTDVPVATWPTRSAAESSGVSPSGVSPSGVSPSGVSPSIVVLDPGPRPSLRLAAMQTPRRSASLAPRVEELSQAAEPTIGRQVIVLFDDKYRVSSLRRSWHHRSWDRIVPALNQDLMQWFGAALGADDRVAVLSHHGRRLRLHQDLTTEPQRWAEALDEVARWQDPPSAAGVEEDGSTLRDLLGALGDGGGSSLEQALVRVAAAAGQLPGQTSVVLVSSRFAGDQISMEGGDVSLRPSRFEAGHQRILDAFQRHQTPIQLLDPWRVGKRGMRAQPLFPSSPGEQAEVPHGDPNPPSV